MQTRELQGWTDLQRFWKFDVLVFHSDVSVSRVASSLTCSFGCWLVHQVHRVAFQQLIFFGFAASLLYD